MTYCVVPDCDEKVIYSRGCCRSDYLYAASLVFHGITTWERLEAEGCVLPAEGAVYSPRRPQRIAWFARGTGMPPDVLQNEIKRRSTEYLRTKRGARKQRLRGVS